VTRAATAELAELAELAAQAESDVFQSATQHTATAEPAAQVQLVDQT
jgi:hypothetical protein